MTSGSQGFVMPGPSQTRTKSSALFSSKSRRSFVHQSILLLGGARANVALADEPAGFDVDNFLKTGAVSMPMGTYVHTYTI